MISFSEQIQKYKYHHERCVHQLDYSTEEEKRFRAARLPLSFHWFSGFAIDRVLGALCVDQARTPSSVQSITNSQDDKRACKNGRFLVHRWSRKSVAKRYGYELILLAFPRSIWFLFACFWFLDNECISKTSLFSVFVEHWQSIGHVYHHLFRYIRWRWCHPLYYHACSNLSRERSILNRFSFPRVIKMRNPYR